MYPDDNLLLLDATAKGLEALRLRDFRDVAFKCMRMGAGEEREDDEAPDNTPTCCAAAACCPAVREAVAAAALAAVVVFAIDARLKVV